MSGNKNIYMYLSDEGKFISLSSLPPKQPKAGVECYKVTIPIAGDFAVTVMGLQRYFPPNSKFVIHRFDKNTGVWVPTGPVMGEREASSAIRTARKLFPDQQFELVVKHNHSKKL